MTQADLWLVLAGALAASVNAAAGGGSLLSFPSLLAVGLSSIAANATSTVGLLPGGFGSVWAYRAELWRLRREALLVTVPSIAGGILGAWLLLHLGGAVFAQVVPALLTAAAALLALQPLVARWLGRAAGPRTVSAGPLVIASAALAVSVYGGYFGAGQGILFLAVMGLLLARPLDETNALKVLCAALNNSFGALTFVVLEARHPTGALVLRDAAPLAIGSILGGYFGVRVVRRVPAPWLRGFASVVGVGIALYLVIER
ncbi:MAG: sulfite exporter TauE/SafE family protein [Deltaproteobacteria bacterium]|nr:sulfite exporter TauE/SafE family protein [Deltaproteobacteria bacterium]